MEYPVKNQVSTGIAYNTSSGYVSDYESWKAAKFCNLDLWKWDNGEYPKHFREYVVAFYRQSLTEENNVQDAIRQKPKK